jgi:sugar (pentulose or hexulose) kinase
LERFFRDVRIKFFGIKADEPLFPLMNQLASAVPAGADGLSCEPLFSGTRACPELRASWHGASAVNFTPAHMIRALLEGMGRTFHQGFEIMVNITGSRPSRLVGAGNGLRENPLLSQIVQDAFAMPLVFPRQREEAAVGAALLAAAAAGFFSDLANAGRTIQYQEIDSN